MLSETFEKFEALPENIRAIVEAPEKREVLKSLREMYDFPLSLQLMQLLVEEISMDDLFSLVSSQMENERDQKNLWYTIEQNFLQPYSLITGKKIPVSLLKPEKEISVQSSVFTPIPLPKVKRFYDFGALAEKVMERFFEIQTDIKEHITKDSFLFKRLKNILVSHLKGVRDDVETRHALMRSEKIGGMNFEEDHVTLLLEFLSSEKPHLGEYVEEFKVEDILRPIRQAQDINLFPERSPKGEVEGTTIGSDHLLSAPKPVIIQKEIEKEKPLLPPSVIKKKKILEKKQEKSIEVRPRLVGPIEELRGLSLVDFRRLSVNPKEAVKKIEERILGLLSESFHKRILAQHAWEESEVYNLYLLLGKASLLSRKSIHDIINDKLLKGNTTLTKDEFDAIMELNSTLRI